jgi:hypothetical protein
MAPALRARKRKLPERAGQAPHRVHGLDTGLLPED